MLLQSAARLGAPENSLRATKEKLLEPLGLPGVIRADLENRPGYGELHRRLFEFQGECIAGVPPAQ